MNQFVGDKQRPNMEREILSHLNLTLKHMSFSGPEELRASLLDPKLVGKVIMNMPYKGTGREFFMGITYVPLRRKNDGEEVDIEGIILDRMGVGVIKGVESHIEGYSGLDFTRKNIVYAGLSKEGELKYECSTPDPTLLSYDGAIVGPLYGKFKLSQNNNSKFLIHNDIAEYYDMFVRGPRLVSKGP